MKWERIVGGGDSWLYLVDENGKILRALHDRYSDRRDAIEAEERFRQHQLDQRERDRDDRRFARDDVHASDVLQHPQDHMAMARVLMTMPRLPDDPDLPEDFPDRIERRVDALDEFVEGDGEDPDPLL